jgi:N-carbamoyl-L-amino-acid hydrolase
MEYKINIPILNITKHLAALSKIGNLGESLEEGFLRASWSDEETAAMDYIRAEGESVGLTARYDAVGNLFISTPQSIAEGNIELPQEVIQIGSHLDTVPRGGLFDGGAGIVAGLEAIKAVVKNKKTLKRRLELVIWRGEESGTFTTVFKGSKAAFGILDSECLNNVYGGVSLRHAIAAQGYDPSVIEQGQATLDQSEIDLIAAHLELHIEQSTKLEKDECDIGVVTSIRGPRRLRVTLHGKAAHSGATPMGSKYRKDANLCMAHIIVALDSLCMKQIAKGDDLVQTVGVINSDKTLNVQKSEIYESAITKVSPLAYFSLDIRSNRKDTLESYSDSAATLIENKAEEFGVRATIETLASSEPLEALDPTLQNAVVDSARSLGYSSQKLASGAGHDVAVVAQQLKSDGTRIPSALVFIPCRDGISHNPLEFASDDALHKGAMVLAETISKYC